MNNYLLRLALFYFYFFSTFTESGDLAHANHSHAAKAVWLLASAEAVLCFPGVNPIELNRLGKQESKAVEREMFFCRILEFKVTFCFKLNSSHMKITFAFEFHSRRHSPVA